MRKIIFFTLLISLSINCVAQLQTFDITNFTTPKGWKQKIAESAIQLSKEDAAKGTYCLITLYKSVPGTVNSKNNFDMAWSSLVKEMVNTTSAPTMQPSAMENGWEVQTGYAPFESDGNKGVAMLITSTGFEKMVNAIILTNTDVYQKDMTSFLGSISFKKITSVANKTQTNTSNPNANTIAKNDGFAFTTSNFDDGWTSTVQEDWVEVTKGTIKVLLHYPKDGTIFPADPEPLTNAAWNILVAPRYSNLKKYKTAYIGNYDRPYLGMGYASENITGRQVFIVLFRQGNSGWIEFIAPDKNSFVQQFKCDPETIQWNSEVSLLSPLSKMATYNKFAIAASDFKGSWSSDFSGVQQMYNVYTGNYAGMNMNQSNQTFQFGAGNTYNWTFIAVNGLAGNAKVAQAKSAGKFTVLNNWQVKFSQIESSAKTYHAFFSCIKGARLLHLLDAQHPGSGIYTIFGKQ